MKYFLLGGNNKQPTGIYWVSKWLITSERLVMGQ